VLGLPVKLLSPTGLGIDDQDRVSMIAGMLHALPTSILPLGFPIPRQCSKSLLAGHGYLR
jgi:hypothetical protein